jgi:DNA-binding transcriptional MocR family regulator
MNPDNPTGRPDSVNSTLAPRAISIMLRLQAATLKLLTSSRVNPRIVTMTIDPADIAHHIGPAYQAIAEALGRSIADGRMRPGDRLPPQRTLAWRLGVTLGTVGRAYELAAQRGLVRGEIGRGTFVQPPLAALAPGWAHSDPAAEEVIDLASNQPSPTAAQAALVEALAALSRSSTVLQELIAYPPVLGLPRHRAAGATWLAELGAPATPERVVVTAGAQAALVSALSTLARPGDTVLVEGQTYNGIKNAARRLGLKLEGVALDEAGVVPDALDAAARHGQARVLVLTPTLQNPTASIMPEARRQAVVAVARARDLTLVEDDVYGPLVPDRPPPLAALAPERVLYLTSAAKFLAPGLRVAFMLVPEALRDALSETQGQLVLANSPLNAELFVRCLETGAVAAAITAQSLEARARQRLAREILPAGACAGAPQGLHVWLDLPDPWTSGEFALALARAGVLVSPAERFHVGRGHLPRAVRISISAPATLERLEAALLLIAGLVRRHGAGAPSLV